jgi:hypothetical protein
MVGRLLKGYISSESGSLHSAAGKNIASISV